MFCGKCGKEMPNSAKFCLHCGAENPAAGNPAPGQAAAPSVPIPSVPAAQPPAGKSLYRIALIALSAIQALMFLMLSYGRLDGWGAGMLSLLGVEVPDRLTALNALRVLSACARLGIDNAQEAYVVGLISFLLPLIMGILVLLLNLLNNTRKSYTISVVLTGVTLLGYLMIQSVTDAFQNMGYELGGGVVLAILVTIIQLIVALRGRRKDRAAVS